MSVNTSAFCKALPKLELHVHLGGSVRHNTILESFTEQGVDCEIQLTPKAFLTQRSWLTLV